MYNHEHEELPETAGQWMLRFFGQVAFAAGLIAVSMHLGALHAVIPFIVAAWTVTRYCASRGRQRDLHRPTAGCEARCDQHVEDGVARRLAATSRRGSMVTID